MLWKKAMMATVRSQKSLGLHCVKEFTVRHFHYVVFFSVINLMTSAASSAVVLCKPEFKVSWVYSEELNSSEFLETNDNLTSTVLTFDLGFIKLSEANENKNFLFRQTSMRSDSNDPLHFTVRYEKKTLQDIKQTNLIISDPMCINNQFLRANRSEIADTNFVNISYNCECLSPIFDINKFIFHK